MAVATDTKLPTPSTAHYYLIKVYTGPDPDTVTASLLPTIAEIPAPPHNWVTPPPGWQIFVMTVPKGGISTLKELK